MKNRKEVVKKLKSILKDKEYVDVYADGIEKEYYEGEKDRSCFNSYEIPARDTQKGVPAIIEVTF